MEMTQKQQALDAIMNLISEYETVKDAMWKERSEIGDSTIERRTRRAESLTKGIHNATNSINALYEAYDRVRFL